MNRLLVAAVATISATACSANSSSFGPVTTTAVSPAMHVRGGSCPKSVVYTSANDGSIVVYDRKNLDGKPCATLKGFSNPEGLFVDSKGTLWIADAGARQVYAFAPGAKAPLATLNDPGGQPAGVTVDERNGTVYVVEYANDANASTLVEVYTKGSTNPTSTLSDPDARNGGSAAVDNQGNLYVTFMTQSNTAQVDRWMGGTGTPQNLGLKLISAGPIVTTKSGALAVCDPFGYRCGIFEPGSQKMSHVFGHMGRGNDIVPNKQPWLFPDGLALDRNERRAFVTSVSLTSWAFPGPEKRPNHLPIDQIKVPGGTDDGVAVSPASLAGNPY